MTISAAGLVESFFFSFVVAAVLFFLFDANKPTATDTLGKNWQIFIERKWGALIVEATDTSHRYLEGGGRRGSYLAVAILRPFDTSSNHQQLRQEERTLFTFFVIG